LSLAQSFHLCLDHKQVFEYPKPSSLLSFPQLLPITQLMFAARLLTLIEHPLAISPSGSYRTHMIAPANANPEQTYQFDEIESHVIDEFIVEFHEAHDEIEAILLQLEHNPDNSELLNNLFRHVHTVKGNLQLIGLDPVAEFVHALESVLDKIRKHTLKFDHQLSDVVLLSIDHAREMCDVVFSCKTLTITEARKVQSELLQIANGSQDAMTRHANNIVRLLDPSIAEQEAGEDQHKEDLTFFAQLAESMESRSPYWIGRTQRILQLTRDLNEETNYAVNPAQLDAAVFIHDIGMAFLPLEILHKASSLSQNEFERIKSHPLHSAQLLEHLRGWEQAHQIILQHHEREDGKGYPNQLMGDQICDGAIILALADTFEAITQERANRKYKRPLLRAISEINNCAGTQFSSRWVDIFNAVIRKKKVKHNKPA
jgi:HD-GYP domain-containing protein (c-di-GMP phosphodiesterase class II)